MTEKKRKNTDVIYEWVDENLMEVKEEKYEQTSHRMISSILATPYRGPTGKVIESGPNVKDLEVIINEKLKFN